MSKSFLNGKVDGKKIDELSPEERRNLLLTTYEISPDEYEEARRITCLEDSMVRVASLIFSGALSKSRSKNTSLAQITAKAMSLAFDFCEDYGANTRQVGGAISSCFKQVREREIQRLLRLGYGARLSNMHMLRKAAFREATGDTLEANVEKSLEAWGDSVQFSFHDLVYGTTIPQKINPVVAFLLGIYSVDGFRGGENTLILSSSTQARSCVVDEEKGEKGFKGLYEAVVYPLVETIFRIDPSANFITPEIRVSSKAHTTWLGEIGFDRPDFPNWRSIPLKNRTKQKDLLDRAFFYGMVSALFKKQHRKKKVDRSYPLYGGGDGKYLLLRMAGRTGFDVASHDPLITLSRAECVKLITAQGLRDLNLPHVGGFYNPHHTQFILDDFVRVAYFTDAKPVPDQNTPTKN